MSESTSPERKGSGDERQASHWGSAALSSFLVVLSGLVLWSLLFLPLLLLSAPLCVASRCWVRLRHKGWLPLHHTQKLLYPERPTNPSHLTGYCVHGAEYTDQHLSCMRDRMRSYLSLPVSLPMRSELVSLLGHVYWKPVQVDVDHHVRVADGFDPEVTYSQEQVEDLLARCGESAFDPQKPLWEIIFVPKVSFQTAVPDNGPQFCFIFRMHHCVCDGIHILNIVIQHLMDDGSPFNPIQAPPALPWWQKAAINAAAILSAPAYILKQMPLYLRLRGHLRPLVGKKLYRLSRALNVDLIRFVKSRTGTQFSDVVMASAAMAIQKQFQRLQYRPEVISNTASAALYSAKTDDLRNNISALYFRFHNRPEDPLQVLSYVSETTSRTVRSIDLLSCYWALYFLGTFFPIHVIDAVLDYQPHVSLMSYIPGCRKALSLYGAPVVIMGSMLPHLARAGVAMSMLTYMDEIRVGVILDEAYVTNGLSDVEDMAEEYVSNIEELANMLGYSKETGYITQEHGENPPKGSHNTENTVTHRTQKT